MPPPQPILDALDAVQSDAEALSTAKAVKSQTATALIDATLADNNAGRDVDAAQAHLATDLAALIALEQQTYSGG